MHISHYTIGEEFVCKTTLCGKSAWFVWLHLFGKGERLFSICNVGSLAEAYKELIIKLLRKDLIAI